MTTVKAVLKKQVRQTDQTHLVMLRLTHARKAVYIGTGVYVPFLNWNENGSLAKSDWVRKHPLKETYNNVIREKILQALELAAEHPTYTSAKLKELLKGEADTVDFISFFTQEVGRLEKEANPRTHQKYAYILRRLIEYVPVLPFDKLTVDWVKKYEQHVLSTNKRNTASKHLAFVKTITRRAVAEGLIAYADNPFLNYKLKGEKPKKDRLTKEEMLRIVELELPEGKRIHQARTAFLLQFFLAGMRIGDLLQMRWEMVSERILIYKDEQGKEQQRIEYRIDYRSQKTDAPLSLLIVPAAWKLIAPDRKPKGFILPFVPEGLTAEAQQKRVESMTALINRMLGEIATAAKIEKKVTTHVARHSFATQALLKSRNMKAVSQALGHGTIVMTETYIGDMLSSEHDELLNTTFEGF